MSKDHNGERKSASDVARERSAVRDVWPGVVALVVLQGTLVVFNPDGRANAWNVIWSFSPLIPALWLVWAQLRSLRRADEYQRLGQLEALAISFGVMIVLSLVGGLADAAKIGSPQSFLQVVFEAGIVTWVAALAVKTWRVS